MKRYLFALFLISLVLLSSCNEMKTSYEKAKEKSVSAIDKLKAPVGGCNNVLVPEQIFMDNYYMSIDFRYVMYASGSTDYECPTGQNIPPSDIKNVFGDEVPFVMTYQYGERAYNAFFEENRPDCRKGSEVGENLNYYYCKPVRYYKERVSDEGTILSPLSYDFTFVLKPTDETVGTYCSCYEKWGDKCTKTSSIYAFDIVDYTCS